ncbi:(-)-kolavenyl diphosphate synthase TPS14, chloroplastic-like [Vitis riparia]|uniref:(-)-kolavenyl diphosphate synthase TPS14, chloroplastic-like n=1 Tax=Vitis riparia TaxID=96939 RepID=UPI00155B106D|nr:(-)-kolavenyl diphosphate synthase TPS14, chloroplastic-like [Vitis riparia]
MSSQSTILFRALSPKGPLPSPSSSTPKYAAGTGWWVAKDKRAHFNLRRECKALPKPQTQEYVDVFQSGLPVIKWHEIVEDDIEEEALQVYRSNEIKERVDSIKSILGSMEDGEISISAYDTAWVALAQDLNGGGTPQFPSSLEWIANNQLMDGSWGDDCLFYAHDRIINTLACVIALKSWKIHPNKCEKGVSFIKENISKLEKEKAEHMPIGFEVAFPSLLEIARNLGIEVPNDSPFLKEIYAQRNLKLTKIPYDIMHIVPTTLLHSLEGMAGLDWEKLLKLQCQDGSFLFSPSSTAYALMQTQDENCFRYLNKVVERFSGGVPNVYPVDLFEHIWAVDRLQRLGISRYFEPEIKECINYVARYWKENGICWAKNSEVHDIDDTAMGFRLLRLHGHDVSADVFKYFEKGGEFFCFAGQSSQAVSGMFNLHRASQVLFPGETILENAKKFSSKFLREKQACDQLLDKWIIMKDLPGEIGYALDVPWYASLPRVETRIYIEQYGGKDDVWIGKTLYRMPYVNNNDYLELAKLDFNNCQALHQLEWDSIQQWYTQCHLGEFGVSRKASLLAYFLAAACIFEPERSIERLAWAKTAILVLAVRSYFSKETCIKQRRAFLLKFGYSPSGGDYMKKINGRGSDLNMTAKRPVGFLKNKSGEELVGLLLGTLNQLSLDTLVAHGRDIRHILRQTWEMWLMKHLDEGDGYRGEAELLVRTINLCAGRSLSEELLAHPQYRRLSQLTNRICNDLGLFTLHKGHNGTYNPENGSPMSHRVESDMQELTKIVLEHYPDGINPEIKRTFEMVGKSFYYAAYCGPATISAHIAKVLFERAG